MVSMDSPHKSSQRACFQLSSKEKDQNHRARHCYSLPRVSHRALVSHLSLAPTTPDYEFPTTAFQRILLYADDE